MVALAAIVAATWVAYWPCLWGEFIWDDNLYVLYNPLLRDVTGLWRIWFEPVATPVYHPLVFSSYWIEYQMWGTTTLGYHAVNVALHTANALIFWAILQRLQSPGAVLAAGIFALHPVHVESVAWVTERKDVLSAFFYGLTMLWWVRFLRTQRERDWMIALALAACALLSKGVLCTLAAALALVAWWKAPWQWRTWTVRLVPFVLISALMAAVTVWREQAHANPSLPYTELERLLIASRAMWTHAAMLVWPAGLTIAYAGWKVSISDPFAYVFPVATLVVIVLLLASRSRHGTGPLAASAFFVVTLSPMLGFVDYNIMRYAFVADHFQYVASGGLIALAAAALCRWTGRWSAVHRMTGAVALLAVLMVLSWRQAGLYKDADTMWRDNLAKNPRSWTAYNYFATAFMRQDRFEDAAAVYRQAIAAMPDHAEAHRSLAVVVASLGRPEEAVELLRKALELDPAHAQTENALGTVLVTLGRAEEAGAHFAAAVRLKPDYAEAWQHWAVADLALGRRDQAIAHLQQAVRLRPDSPEARAGLERLLATP
jgi:tetratricopeptide (TPR) repeat protein